MTYGDSFDADFFDSPFTHERPSWRSLDCNGPSRAVLWEALTDGGAKPLLTQENQPIYASRLMPKLWENAP